MGPGGGPLADADAPGPPMFICPKLRAKSSDSDGAAVGFETLREDATADADVFDCEYMG